MDAMGIFCAYIVPGINGILIPLLFLASFVSFTWGVFHYAIVGEYDEFAREMSKGLMLWSILAFIFMVIVFGIAGFAYDAVGLSAAICQWYTLSIWTASTIS